MGQKDLSQKHLESYPDVFADVVNALLYEGRQMVKENELVPAPTESFYRTDGKRLRNQFQDVSQYVLQNGKIQMQYLLENQTKIERRHVLRKAGYTGAAYRRQYDNRELYPVAQLVLYWGRKRWKSPNSLKGLLRKNPFVRETDEYIDEMKLHVYEMAHLPKEVRQRFHSDLRVVVDYLAEGKDYRPGRRRIVHVEAFLCLLGALTGDARYEELIPEFQGREDVGVCELLDKYENRGMKKGLKKGEETTLVANIKALMETMGWTMDKAMEALKVPKKKRDYYAKKVQG